MPESGEPRDRYELGDRVAFLKPNGFLPRRFRARMRGIIKHRYRIGDCYEVYCYGPDGVLSNVYEVTTADILCWISPQDWTELFNNRHRDAFGHPL